MRNMPKTARLGAIGDFLGAIAIGALAAALVLASCSKTAVGEQRSGQGPGKSASGAPGAAATEGNGGPGGGKQYAGHRQAVVPVQAVTVQEGLLTADRTTAGVVNTVVQSQVATQVAGVVKSVLHLAGDWVRTGDIVMQLDDSQLKLSFANAQAALDTAKVNLDAVQDSTGQNDAKFRLQVQSAQSQVDSAQKTYDSQKALFDLGGISASALDQAKSNLATAQAGLESANLALEQNKKGFNTTPSQNVDALKIGVLTAENNLAQARLNLQYASIRAPFAGQIAAVNMQSGMYVGLNTPVFTIVSASRQINFSIPPSDAPALPLGAAIGFEYSGSSFPIKVSQAPSAPINGVVPMVASVPPSLKLPFGTVGSVSYKVSVASGILVPLNALSTIENQNFVFKIAGGKAVTQSVTILGEAGITTAVSGLKAGDVVVVNPPPGLIQGSTVQAVMLQQGAKKP
jgi:HlyD family secretion protein